MATSIRERRARLEKPRGGADWSGELFPMFLMLWVVSVVRVAFAIARHETFGVIATMALLSIVLLPLLLRNGAKQ